MGVGYKFNEQLGWAVMYEIYSHCSDCRQSPGEGRAFLCLRPFF